MATAFVCAALGCLTGSVADVGGIALTRAGRSVYRIVIAADAGEDVRLAAEELRAAFRRISGAELPIAAASGPPRTREILVGDSSHLAKLVPRADLGGLGDQGFLIRVVGQSLVIAGATPLATLYGVYTFLEQHLGCVWCSATASYFPDSPTIRLDPIDERHVPALRWREVYYSEAMDPAFARRLRLNGNASVVTNGRLVLERHRGWNLWCHSFFTLVPPDRYFADHPDYYALVDGKRVTNGQLCLTNPGTLRVTIDSLRKLMADDPEAQYWSVSQNDCAGNCQCDACRAVDEREGTPMGSLLEFINAIAAEFPDKTISTLAYQYSRRPPRTLRPAKNVAIMLCSIECNRSRPIATDPDSESFRADVEAWARICDNLQVWDYVVQFSNLVSPFPNLRVLQPNMRFFVDSHATGVFSQGNRECHGEFAELRTYVLAHLSWNPDADVDPLIARFLAAYYGPAAVPLGAYIREMHDSLESSEARLDIFGGPGDHRGGYLSAAMLDRYGALFDEAESAVRDDPERLLRVRAARLPLQYAVLALRHGDVASRRSVADALFRTADEIGVLMFNEWNLPTAEYRKRVMAELDAE